MAYRSKYELGNNLKNILFELSMLNLTFRVVRTLVLAKNIPTKLYNPSMQIPEFGEKNLRIQIRHAVLFFFL